MENILVIIIVVYLNYRENKKTINKLLQAKEKNNETSDINQKDEQNNYEIPVNTFYPNPS